MLRMVFLVAISCLAVQPTVHAAEPPTLAGFTLSEPKTYRLKVTVCVEAPRTALRNVTANGPVPIEWPEQQLRLIGEEKSPGARTQVVDFPGQAGMLVVQVPVIPAGGSGGVERVYEVTRYRMQCLLKPEQLRRAEELSRELRTFLTSAPGLNTADRRITKLTESLKQPDADAWTQTRSYFDWVRQNVKYEVGPYRGATHALENGAGDCEDMAALFVAMCRAKGIPARSVWIEGHAYAEFYLEDEQGEGYWIPAQLAGPEWFGEMAEYCPILQKGDRFRDPISRRYVRYVPQSARAEGGMARLVCTREILSDPEVHDK